MNLPSKSLTGAMSSSFEQMLLKILAGQGIIAESEAKLKDDQ